MQMTDVAVKQSVFYLFNTCYLKLSDDDKTTLRTYLNNVQLNADTFYDHVSKIVLTTVNTEEMAVKKAVKSKVVSWYNREYKKLYPPVVAEPQYDSVFLQKTLPVAGPKVDKKLVPINDPKSNSVWDAGITRFCIQLVSVGLASFGTFAAYFFYCNPRDSSIRFAVKLMADKDNGGKKIVFVRN